MTKTVLNPTIPAAVPAPYVRTRELFASVEWTPDRNRTATVFLACWGLALPRFRIAAAAEALTGMGYSDIEGCLTGLVRAGVLRSRVSCGERLYEVALD